MKSPKKPRTIPAEHLCPIATCGGRMKFTHSSPVKAGTMKRRKCVFCGYEDKALLRIEVLKLVAIVRNHTLGKKNSGKRAISHGTKGVKRGTKLNKTNSTSKLK